VPTATNWIRYGGSVRSSRAHLRGFARRVHGGVFGTPSGALPWCAGPDRPQGYRRALPGLRPAAFDGTTTEAVCASLTFAGVPGGARTHPIRGNRARAHGRLPSQIFRQERNGAGLNEHGPLFSFYRVDSSPCRLRDYFGTSEE